MFVRAYHGPKKSLRLTLADTIPELDEEQVYAAWCMAKDKRKLLFSDPGAGKTLTAIQAMLLVEEELEEREERPSLTAVILVPSIAIGTWVRWISAAYDAVGRSCVIQVVKAGYDKIREDTTHLILTYGIVSQKEVSNVVEVLQGCNTAIFIADESDNLTGVGSNRTRRVFGEDYTGGKGSIVSCAEWLWFLTGTPIPRYNDGLFPVLRAVFPEKLVTLVGAKGQHYEEGTALTRKGFEFIFCRTELVKFGHMQKPQERVMGSRNNKLLNDILFGGAEPIAIRIKLKLHAQLVEREITIEPKFSKEFKRLEAELEEVPYIMEEVRALDSRLAKAQSMMAFECAPAVAEYVKDCFKKERSNSPVTLGKVVLYYHTHAGLHIGDLLERAGYSVRYINGSTKTDENIETERLFNAGKIDVVVGQIKAMGVAINLQENCDHVVFAEETYSHASNMQAYQRVYRRGQSRTVRVDYCRPLSFLADIKVMSAFGKGKSAGEVLDGTF